MQVYHFYKLPFYSQLLYNNKHILSLWTPTAMQRVMKVTPARPWSTAAAHSTAYTPMASSEAFRSVSPRSQPTGVHSQDTVSEKQNCSVLSICGPRSGRGIHTDTNKHLYTALNQNYSWKIIDKKRRRNSFRVLQPLK